jgi:hypothetical protein
MPALKKNRLDSQKVLAHFQKRGTLTTQQVATYHKVTPQQAAAGIAILRIKDVVEPADPPKTKDGVSRWTYTGPKKQKK